MAKKKKPHTFEDTLKEIHEVSEYNDWLRSEAGKAYEWREKLRETIELIDEMHRRQIIGIMHWSDAKSEMERLIAQLDGYLERSSAPRAAGGE